METSATSTRSYQPVPWAVLPGTVARAIPFGLLYIPITVVVLAYLSEVLPSGGVEQASGDVEPSVGFALVVASSFLIPFVGCLLLALVGYGRRRYELGAEGITEHRGILLSRETFFDYDDIEEVTFTQSKLQSMYGAGTVRISEIDSTEDTGKTVKFQFIRNPEAVYTNVLRTIADATGKAGEFDLSDVGQIPSEAEEISRLSGDDLAAGTGFRYLMPNAIVHPDPFAAAKYGALLSVAYSLAGAIVLTLLQPLVIWGLDIPSQAHYRAIIGFGAVVYAVILGVWFYRQYDERQYELYEDHIRFVGGGERVSVSLGDIDSLERQDGTVTTNNIGHIALLDEDGDQLRRFEFINEPDGIYESLEQWALSHKRQQLAEGTLEK